MVSHVDTIIAPITGSGPAPVAIIRLSGPEAWEMAALLCQSVPQLAPLVAQYRRFVTGDDGYLVLFEAKKSFTGEESAELSIHGSRASIAALLVAGRNHGARFAEPGEFTQRAFMNGRIDLTEAEAVRDTIEAETEAQLRMANLLREGALKAKLRQISDGIQGVLAAIEASVDFSEEIGEIDPQSLASRLSDYEVQLQALLDSTETGRILREGLRIAIVGPPNVGKSSLLNRLLDSDRSIVTDFPGTTRDYVEERANFSGFPVVLIDTAGLRETLDPIEAIGVQKSRSIAAHADLIWFVTDAQSPVEPPKYERPIVLISNKVDLASAPPGFIGISCLSGMGIDQLVQQTIEQFDNPLGFAIQARHEPELLLAKCEIETARLGLQHGRPPDLAAIGLRNAFQAIGRVTGDTADIDMIARIFKDFCIGK